MGKLAGGSVIVYKHNYGEDISDVFANMSHQEYQRAAIFRLEDKYYELYYKPVKENAIVSPIIFSLPSEKFMSSPLSRFLLTIGQKKSSTGNLLIAEKAVLVLEENGSKDKFLELLFLLGYKKDAYKTTNDGENIYVFSPKE